jgi:hypothetical protein
VGIRTSQALNAKSHAGKTGAGLMLSAKVLIARLLRRFVTALACYGQHTNAGRLMEPEQSPAEV